MKPERSSPRLVPLPVGAAALALPLVLWHGGAATAAASIIVAVAVIALMLAPRRALGDAALRLSAVAAESERQASARVRAAEDEARAPSTVAGGAMEDDVTSSPLRIERRASTPEARTMHAYRRSSRRIVVGSPAATAG